MTEPALRLPALDLLLDGAPLPERFGRCLNALRVHQHLSQPSACELSFTGIDDEALALFKAGARLKLAVRSAGQVLFDGSISAVEIAYGSDRVRSVAVRAYDALLALRNRQTARAFVGLNAADVARELIADLGLAVQCAEHGPNWPRVLQTGTDFDMLVEITERSGLYFALQDDALWLHTLQGHGAALALTLYDNLYEATFEANAHGASHSVAVLGWNPWRGSEHVGRANNVRSGRTAAQLVRAHEIGGVDPRWLAPRCLQSDEQAASWAQAELDARGAQALTLRGTSAGDARLRPGARVRVGGVAARLSGEHVLCSVRHTLDPQRGFLSEISTAPPLPRERESGTLLALGQVVRIDDPDRLGRVQVTLPAHGNIESDWLQVVAAGAGKGKGLVAMPDVGDRVLLLVERSDLAQAVVLGSLYGEGGLPEDQGGLGPQASFCLVTPGGHRLRMDDGARSIHITGIDGSHIEMSPEGVRLHAAAPMTIEAPGQTLTIRAEFIDFQRG